MRPGLGKDDRAIVIVGTTRIGEMMAVDAHGGELLLILVLLG